MTVRYMVENRTKSEQLFEQARGPRPPAGTRELPKAKILDRMKSAINLFVKPWMRAGVKAATGPKAASPLLPAVFSAQKIELKSINQVLALVLAGLIALTVYFGFSERPSVASVSASVAKIKFQDLEDKAITPFQELAFYLDQFKKRDIFNEYEEPKPPPPVVVPVEPPPPPPPPKVTIQEKAKNFKLIGISWGDHPKAMIKDEATAEVYFLDKGQKIKGTDIEVRKILKDQVIIGSEDDEMKML